MSTFPRVWGLGLGVIGVECRDNGKENGSSSLRFRVQGWTGYCPKQCSEFEVDPTPETYWWLEGNKGI